MGPSSISPDARKSSLRPAIPKVIARSISPDRGVFISGDALVTLDVLTRESGPRLLPDPVNVDSAQARASLGRLDGIEADLLLPGHGEPYTGPLAGAVESARNR